MSATIATNKRRTPFDTAHAHHYTPAPSMHEKPGPESIEGHIHSPAAPRTGVAALLPLYCIEALASIAGTLLSIGISFYMKDRFHWDMRQNFLLAAGQGLIYVPGALLAGWFSTRLGARMAFCACYVVLVLISVAAWAMAGAQGPWWGIGVAAALLAYTFVIGISWPILEGLVAQGGAPAGMAHRLAVYNVVWPAAGALAIAVEGTVMKYWMAGLFIIPAAMHLISLLLLGVQRPIDSGSADAHPPLRVEPELLRKRKLALWLSRTALPATYTVIYGLMPIMPFLTVMRHLSTSKQTLVASV
ncbi:MAG TPA: MFS transporter, partial [Tepidisphaeraceae bacterium]|nr:MFS transporter [Tepidisphaeraceae bacterium]